MDQSENSLFIPECKWALSKESFLAHAPFINQLILGNTPDASVKKNTAASIRYAIDDSGKKLQSSKDEIPPNSVGVVSIRGLMIRYGTWYMWGADEIISMMEYFDNHPNIIGQVVAMNTGGGMTTAAGPYLNFFENKKKPVVSLIDGCGSLGVLVQSCTDYTIADNNFSSYWGSVGIMAHYTSYAEYYKELGIIEHTIYSNHSEHKNEGFDKAMKGEYDLIKKEDLDPMALKFQEHVKNKLPNLKHSKKGVLTGKTFYADEALKIKAINEIGNMQTAVEKVHQLSQAQKALEFLNT